MALIKCTECGQIVSDKATVCPGCGCPISEILKGLHKNSAITRNSDGSVNIGSLADAFCKILENCPDDWSDVTNYYHELTNTGSISNKGWWIRNFYFLLPRYLTEDAVKAISADPENDYLLLNNYIKDLFDQKKEDGKFKNPALSHVLYVVGKTNGIVSLDNLSDVREQEWIVTHPELKDITLEQVKEWFPSEQGDEIYSLLITEEIPKKYTLFYHHEWEYLISKIFADRRPTYEDNFGAFDVCKMIYERYDCSEDIYAVVAVINNILGGCDYQKDSRDDMRGRNLRLTCGDRRSVTYRNYMYAKKEKSLLESNVKEYHGRIFESDPKNELSKMIQNAKENIALSYEEAKTGEKKCFLYSNSICFSEAEIRQAKELYDTAAAKYDEMMNKQRARQEAIRINEKIIDSTTVTPVIAGQIKGAKCPNCGKETVRKISNLKRTVSIGIFGIFSKDIAKTMECASCGYKW